VELDPTTQEGTQQTENRTLSVQLLRRKKVKKTVDRIGARRSRENGDIVNAALQGRGANDGPYGIEM
jgi:hypothetical protein